MALPIEELGRLVLKKRGTRGIRAAAAEAEVPPATLSRIENGHIPDLGNFAKVCRWLEVNPSLFLGVEPIAQQQQPTVVHFRKKKTVSKETAEALGHLILRAQAEKDARLKLLQR
jgi:transcriptional regulator with XRE-family HTH domain